METHQHAEITDGYLQTLPPSSSQTPLQPILFCLLQPSCTNQPPLRQAFSAQRDEDFLAYFFYLFIPTPIAIILSFTSTVGDPAPVSEEVSSKSHIAVIV